MPGLSLWSWIGPKTAPGSKVNIRIRSCRPVIPSISGPRSTVVSSSDNTPLVSGAASVLIVYTSVHLRQYVPHLVFVRQTSTRKAMSALVPVAAPSRTGGGNAHIKSCRTPHRPARTGISTPNSYSVKRNGSKCTAGASSLPRQLASHHNSCVGRPVPPDDSQRRPTGTECRYRLPDWSPGRSNKQDSPSHPAPTPGDMGTLRTRRTGIA